MRKAWKNKWKRICATVLAAAMTVTMLPANTQAATPTQKTGETQTIELVANGEFKTGIEGWDVTSSKYGEYVNETGKIEHVASGDDGYLKVSGRKQGGNGALYDLSGKIKKGTKYTVTGKLKYDEGPDTHGFFIVFQNGANYAYRYTKWGAIQAVKGQWASFKLEYIPFAEGNNEEYEFSETQNYFFIGGTYSKEGKEAVVDSYCLDDISITYEGVPQKYTVTLDAQGGTLDQESMEAQEGRKIGELPVPTKEGYTFKGWYTAATKGTKITKDTFIDGNMTIYAQWLQGIGEIQIIELVKNGEFKTGIDGWARMPSEQGGDVTSDDGCLKVINRQSTASGAMYDLTGKLNKETEYTIKGKLKYDNANSPDTRDFEVVFKNGVDYNNRQVAGKFTARKSEWVPFEIKYTPTDAVDYLNNTHEFTTTQNLFFIQTSWVQTAEPDRDLMDYYIDDISITYEGIPQKYTVTLDAQEGTLDKPSMEAQEGRKIGELPTPTRDGYIFKGWYTAAAGGTEVTEDTFVDSNITIYARWEEVADTDCIVTLDANEGTVTPTQITVTKGGKIPYATLPTPIRDGYIFKGWYTEATGGTEVTANTVVDGAMTIYARWEKVADTDCVVYLNANGGTVTPTQITVTKGGKIPYATLSTPTRDGYTFKGWYTEATGGTEVTADTDVNGTMTIYAQWEKEPEQPGTEKWTVTFNVNGGNALSAADATREVIKGQAIGNLPIATRTGYTFKGWYTAQTDGEKVTAATTVNSDMTVYAQWEKEQEQPGTQECTVTFDVNGGNELTDTTRKVTKGGTIGELPTPSKDGYTFKGWYTLAENGEVVTKDTVVNSDMTIYAQWTAKPGTQECTVTFDVNGGNELTNTTRKVMKGGKIGELPTVTRDGYTFKGWYTKAENGEAVTKDTVVDSDMTVYAQWTAQQGSEDEPKEASKTEMSGKINEAKTLLDKLNDAEKGKLQAAIKKAEDILKKDGLTESELKTAINELKAAIDAANKTVGSGGTDGPKDEKPAVGMAFETADGLKYVITAYGSAGKTVTVTGAAKQLTAVTIPDTVSYKNETFTVTAVGEQAFVGQTGLKSVVIGKNVASIGKKAFFNVSSLAKVTINGTDVKMGADAFKGISKKATFNMPKNFTSGKLKYKITKNTASVKEASVSGATGQLKSVQIPATVKYNGIVFKVTAVDKKAFKNQKKLTSVTVGKNVKSIGAEAFSGAKKLAKIKFSGTAVKKIGKNAFKNIKKNATFQVKKSKRAYYKKLLKKAGTKNYKVK